jgi:hypothetical protein
MNQTLRYRRHDNPHVEPERPVAQVIQIVFDAPLHLLDLVCLPSVSVDFCPSCYPGLIRYTDGCDPSPLSDKARCVQSHEAVGPIPTSRPAKH